MLATCIFTLQTLGDFLAKEDVALGVCLFSFPPGLGVLGLLSWGVICPFLGDKTPSK